MDIQFVKVDVEEWPQLSNTFHVRYLPTILFFQKDVLLEEITGFKNAEQLKGRVLAWRAELAKDKQRLGATN